MSKGRKNNQHCIDCFHLRKPNKRFWCEALDEYQDDPEESWCSIFVMPPSKAVLAALNRVESKLANTLGSDSDITEFKHIFVSERRRWK